jgi:hypothetical protein
MFGSFHWEGGGRALFLVMCILLIGLLKTWSVYIFKASIVLFLGLLTRRSNFRIFRKKLNLGENEVF